MAQGRLWVKWAFRVVGPRLERERLTRGIRDFTAAWLHGRGLPPDDGVFKIKVKRVRAPSTWEQGLLRRQMNAPWYDAGTARWIGGKFQIQIPPVESL
jgi:hypothetical protein